MPIHASTYTWLVHVQAYVFHTRIINKHKCSMRAYATNTHTVATHILRVCYTRPLRAHRVYITSIGLKLTYISTSHARMKSFNINLKSIRFSSIVIDQYRSKSIYMAQSNHHNLRKSYSMIRIIYGCTTYIENNFREYDTWHVPP